MSGALFVGQLIGLLVRVGTYASDSQTRRVSYASHGVAFQLLEVTSALRVVLPAADGMTYNSTRHATFNSQTAVSQKLECLMGSH